MVKKSKNNKIYYRNFINNFSSLEKGQKAYSYIISKNKSFLHDEKKQAEDKSKILNKPYNDCLKDLAKNHAKFLDNMTAIDSDKKRSILFSKQAQDLLFGVTPEQELSQDAEFYFAKVQDKKQILARNQKITQSMVPKASKGKIPSLANIISQNTHNLEKAKVQEKEHEQSTNVKQKVLDKSRSKEREHEDDDDLDL